jgi:hypothetical protein
MKDPHSVLHEHEKEQALERVRREIQAVLSVIPILVDDQPSSDVVHEVLLAFSPTPVDPSDNDHGTAGDDSHLRHPAGSKDRCPFGKSSGPHDSETALTYLGPLCSKNLGCDCSCRLPAWLIYEEYNVGCYCCVSASKFVEPSPHRTLLLTLILKP